MAVYKVKPELTGEGTEIYPVVINKSDEDIYNEAESALTGGKPILWYEDANTCYYIDTITKSGTDIVLTKGGKTITIESDNTVTEVGEIQEKLYQYLIRMILNSDRNGTGDTLDINIRYITNKKLPLYNEETLTQEIANNVIDNYEQLIFNEDNNEIVGAFRDEKFDNIGIPIDAINDYGDAFIVANSTISIKQIF